MKIKETPIHDRPREKMCAFGPSYLTNEELVSILLGSGTKGIDIFTIAKRVSEYLEDHLLTIRDDYTKLYRELQRIKGVGSARASLLIAAYELASRFYTKKVQVIKCAADILPFVSYISKKRQEYFLCIHLDGANRVVANRVVTIGLIDQALVHPREVFSEAVSDKAAKVIVAHNHPAGGLIPSDEDKSITKNLQKASEILGITFLDHIIISEEGYFSFREKGML